MQLLWKTIWLLLKKLQLELPSMAAQPGERGRLRRCAAVAGSQRGPLRRAGLAGGRAVSSVPRGEGGTPARRRTVSAVLGALAIADGDPAFGLPAPGRT